MSLDSLKIRRNARWLLRLTALVGVFGFVGCSDTPAQQAAVVQETTHVIETKPSVVERQPSVDELLAQTIPGESCLDTLKNIRYALDTELFLRPEFYTPENVQRFFGDSYSVDPKYSNMKRKNTAIDPCISDIHFVKRYYNPWSDISKGPLKKMYIVIRTTSSIDDKPKLIKIDDLLEQLELKEPIHNRSRNNSDVFWYSQSLYGARHSSTNWRATVQYYDNKLERFEKKMTQHSLGCAVLSYISHAPHSKISIVIVTYRDGSIAEFEVYIDKE